MQANEVVRPDSYTLRSVNEEHTESDIPRPDVARRLSLRAFGAFLLLFVPAIILAVRTGTDHTFAEAALESVLFATAWWLLSREQKVRRFGWSGFTMRRRDGYPLGITEPPRGTSTPHEPMNLRLAIGPSIGALVACIVAAAIGLVLLAPAANLVADLDLGLGSVGVFILTATPTAIFVGIRSLLRIATARHALEFRDNTLTIGPAFGYVPPRRIPRTEIIAVATGSDRRANVDRGFLRIIDGAGNLHRFKTEHLTDGRSGIDRVHQIWPEFAR